MSEEFPIKPHRHNKAAGRESHHPESQTALKRAVAGYKPGRDKTMSMPEEMHKKTFKPQRKLMAKPDYEKKLGLSKSIRDAAKIMRKAGASAKAAGQAAMEHDGYLKGTTPLDKVKGVLQKFWAAGGQNPKTSAKPKSGAAAKPNSKAAAKPNSNASAKPSAKASGKGTPAAKPSSPPKAATSAKAPPQRSAPRSAPPSPPSRIPGLAKPPGVSASVKPAAGHGVAPVSFNPLGKP
jgi:hypothetical protein